MTKAAKREYKDSVFRSYFSEAEKAKSLYSALSGIPKDEIEEIEIVTLDNVMFGIVKNDLSFTIGIKFLIMIEHMSYISENIPLTMLKYFIEQIEKMVSNNSLHKRSLIKIPAPEFYVLYNGIEETPKQYTMKLSNAFLGFPSDDCSMELKVKVIDINYDESSGLLKKCEEVKQYAAFIDKIREYERQGMSKADAIKNAVKYCISNGVMVDFLKEHESEVQDMLLEPITREELEQILYEEALQKGLEQGLEQGLERGLEQGLEQGLERGLEQGLEQGRDEGRNLEKKENAKKLKAAGTPVEVIAECLGLSVEEINSL